MTFRIVGIRAPGRRIQSLSRLLLSLGALTAGLLPVLLVPASASAAITTFGSPLSVPATLNTTENLGYYGTYTDVPPSPEAPSGVFHTNHWATDTALWNVALTRGDPSAPASGQAVKVSLEGCAQPAPGGPSPLTQIHFQDITPLSGGGARVNLTSQPFEIPVCGQNGASGRTITTYEPINLCVSRGDYVAFNDEGGYVPFIYRSGVPYHVIGNAHGSTMDSFIRAIGTDNGDTMSSGDTTANDGFASNGGEELMLRATLGTGPDARYVCPGGTKDAPPVLLPIDVHHQTDGINHSRVVAVAVYCRLTPECKGAVTLSLAGKQVSVGSGDFSVLGDTTGHVPIRVVPSLMGLIRRDDGVMTRLTAVVAGKTFTQMIDVKIF